MLPSLAEGERVALCCLGDCEGEREGPCGIWLPLQHFRKPEEVPEEPLPRGSETELEYAAQQRSPQVTEHARSRQRVLHSLPTPPRLALKKGDD